MSERNADEETQHPRSPVKKQHPQLRALLFNRLGLFEVSSDGITNNSRRRRTEPRNKKASSAITSQQYLKDDANSCIRGGASAPTNHRGIIRFNSIVSVVGIPTRSQYSDSARRLLWGKESYSFGSDEEDDNSTKESQDDPVLVSEHQESDTDDEKNKDKPRRPKLMRKCSFHI